MSSAAIAPFWNIPGYDDGRVQCEVDGIKLVRVKTGPKGREFSYENGVFTFGIEISGKYINITSTINQSDSKTHFSYVAPKDAYGKDFLQHRITE